MPDIYHSKHLYQDINNIPDVYQCLNICAGLNIITPTIWYVLKYRCEATQSCMASKLRMNSKHVRVYNLCTPGIVLIPQKIICISEAEKPAIREHLAIEKLHWDCRKNQKHTDTSHTILSKPYRPLAVRSVRCYIPGVQPNMSRNWATGLQ